MVINSTCSSNKIIFSPGVEKKVEILRNENQLLLQGLFWDIDYRQKMMSHKKFLVCIRMLLMKT